jgi:predicted DNA-binding antitoxin AbrB/MazE fold protein
MTKMIEAVYEKGMLRPLDPLTGIEENSHVRVTVITDETENPISECVGILPNDDAREMKQIIKDEFAKVNLDEWK